MKLQIVAFLLVLAALAAPAASALPLELRGHGLHYDLPAIRGDVEGPLVSSYDQPATAPAAASPSSQPQPPAPAQSSDPSQQDAPLLPVLIADFPPEVSSTLHMATRSVDDITGSTGLTQTHARASAPQPTHQAAVWYVGHDAPVAAQAIAASPVAAGASLAAVAAVSAAGPAAAGALWERLRKLAPLAALYTRIAKERLLDHGGRERLLEAVRASPGLALADAARIASIPRNTAVYHLTRLEREGLVSSMRQGRTRLYFAPGGLDQRANADALAALRHPVTLDIANVVGAEPGLDQQSLCARFGIAPSLAHWHASRLVSAGIVSAQRDGRRVRYYPGASYDLVRARSA